ncbi:MAG TPA: S53 family peptidase [Trebonia sp.]|nr:S53 family peptidase [Trebonia sp.]
MTRLRAIVAAGAATLLAVGGGVAAATSASASVHPARLSVAGTHPAWATAKALVSTKVSGSVTANVYLADRDAAGLSAYAAAVSTPGNRLYGHYLTAKEALARFAPTAAEAKAVESWAKGAGLKAGAVTSGAGAYVQVTGSAAAIATAFTVKFGMYKDGKATYRAPAQAASIPGSIASDVLTVSGLDSAKDQMKPNDTLPPAPANYFVAPYCSTYYAQKVAAGQYGTVPGTTTKIPTVNGKAQPWTNCGYTPQQIRGAYNVNGSGETGKGVTVAVVDAYASPTMASDANQYAAWARANGGSKALDKPFAPGQYKQVLLGDTDGWTQTAADECDASGWYGEESLDVESVHGMAPNANVTYVGAVSCEDTDLGNALAYIVDNHTANIVTDSWGEPADDSTLSSVYDSTFELGATEGIGFFFSAGDSGYEDPNYEDATDKVEVDYPDSSPWVTSVGGTSLAIGASNNYESETSWGTILDPLAVSSNGKSSWAYTPADTTDEVLNGYWDGSTGGGVSATYTQPWYQKGVVPKQLATTEVVTTPVSYQGSLFGYDESLTTVNTQMRVTPDVSALADPSTGTAVGETLLGTDGKTYGFYVSRIGGTSLASPVFAGIEADAEQAAGHPIGFANPAIYSLAKAPGVQAFHDVTDHPGGASALYEVRSNYTNPDTKELPLVTYLRRLGVNGIDATLNVPASATVTIPLTVRSALTATKGYDDGTGVGSPDNYIDAFK